MADDAGELERAGLERRTRGGVRDTTPDLADVRDEDLEPHAGLRYIARLFKVLALLLFLVMVGEVVLSLMQGTRVEIVLLAATRLLVLSALLWAGADLGLMLIESNHDLRATRILVGRLNGKVQRLEAAAFQRDDAGSRPERRAGRDGS